MTAVVDLRVDWHDEPIAELRRIWVSMHRSRRPMNRAPRARRRAELLGHVSAADKLRYRSGREPVDSPGGSCVVRHGANSVRPRPSATDEPETILVDEIVPNEALGETGRRGPGCPDGQPLEPRHLFGKRAVGDSCIAPACEI